MHFTEDAVVKGVRERLFDIERDGRRVPGLLWTPPEAEGPRPLVLIGHGASGSKREDYVVALGRRLARHLGYAAVAIDGPVHGGRRTKSGPGPDAPFFDFGQMWSSDPTMTDAMVADWRATIDALHGESDIGVGAVGYWGLSMGTILGLPTVAAEPRITVAVLGLMGLTGPTKTRMATDAPDVSCPVLFLLQWHDELFPREKVCELFGALGSSDKRLHAHPGRHGDVPLEGFEASERFLALHLGT
ncbi:MAG TPA: dienelactone hydrolase family protein [Acidimicrobiales bacterium]|nr:dienelactone hydrolase family protein [Acidimicrobiales bacterium]